MKVKFTGEKFDVLTNYGYEYSIGEAGWISADGATVVSENRSPYQRQIMQYSQKDELHEKNITVLIEAGLAERVDK